MSIPAERLRHLADTKRGIDDPQDIGYYESCALAEDIAFFCKVLICGPGVRLNTPPLTLEIRRDLDGIPSDLPHNALHDARALMASHLELEYRLPSTVSGSRYAED